MNERALLQKAVQSLTSGNFIPVLLNKLFSSVCTRKNLSTFIFGEKLWKIANCFDFSFFFQSNFTSFHPFIWKFNMVKKVFLNFACRFFATFIFLCFEDSNLDWYLWFLFLLMFILFFWNRMIFVLFSIFTNKTM